MRTRSKSSSKWTRHDISILYTIWKYQIHTMTASPISAISALYKYNVKLKHGDFESKH